MIIDRIEDLKYLGYFKKKNLKQFRQEPNQLTNRSRPWHVSALLKTIKNNATILHYF